MRKPQPVLRLEHENGNDERQSLKEEKIFTDEKRKKGGASNVI
jgi:hypothetical protein